MINAIEICCCAGGMALGFRRAGIEFAFAFDKDADACASYEHNLGHRPIRMDVHDLLRLVQGGWRPDAGELDFVCADPPCVSWSSAGLKKGLADARDCLRPVVEIVRILRPRAFLLGNVPGLEHERADAARRDTIGSLCYEGYCIDEAVLDAASYGVPQRRIRPFWYLHLGGPCLAWPNATHGPPSRQGQLVGTELLPWVTCRDALADLPRRDLGKARRVRLGKTGDHRPNEPDAPAATVTANSHGDGSLLVLEDGFPPSHEDAPARTVTTRASAGGNRMLVAHPRHPASKADEPAYTMTTKPHATGSNIMTWPWDRPATTVTTEARIPAPGHKSPSRRTFDECIVLSERARARLQGFPDLLCGCNGGYPLHLVEFQQKLVESGEHDAKISQVCQDCWLPMRPYKFVGKTKRSRNSQLGQAMPPPLAEAIARSIIEWFERVHADEVLAIAEVVGDVG